MEAAISANTSLPSPWCLAGEEGTESKCSKVGGQALEVRGARGTGEQGPGKMLVPFTNVYTALSVFRSDLRPPERASDSQRTVNRMTDKCSGSKEQRANHTGGKMFQEA